MKLGKQIKTKEELEIGKSYCKIYGFCPDRQIPFTVVKICKHFWNWPTTPQEFVYYVVTRKITKELLTYDNKIQFNSFGGALFLNDMGVGNPSSPNKYFEILED